MSVATENQKMAQIQVVFPFPTAVGFGGLSFVRALYCCRSVRVSVASVLALGRASDHIRQGQLTKTGSCVVPRPNLLFAV
jgi:hypothetical protein